MTPEPPKPIEETQKEFDDAMEQQGFKQEPKDTRDYGKKATQSGTPSREGDIF